MSHNFRDDQEFGQQSKADQHLHQPLPPLHKAISPPTSSSRAATLLAQILTTVVGTFGAKSIW
jgi:hypothetical protein